MSPPQLTTTHDFRGDVSCDPRHSNSPVESVGAIIDLAIQNIIEHIVCALCFVRHRG